MPPTPTTRAPSVLGVCGWVSAPRRALPRVYRRLVCSLGVSAPPRRVVRRTTMPRVSRRASAHALRACREGAGRSHGSYPPPTGPRSPHRATPLSHKRSLHPCTTLTVHSGPAPDTTQTTTREVHAGRDRGGRAVRDDCPRSQRHRVDVVFASRTVWAKYPFYPPLKDTSSTPCRPGAPGSGARRAVRAPVGDSGPPPGGVQA